MARETDVSRAYKREMMKVANRGHTPHEMKLIKDRLKNEKIPKVEVEEVIAHAS